MCPTSMPDFADVLRQRIVHRTGGRIYQLAVVAEVGRILVRGWARSFYHKQLAIQACLEMLDAAVHPRLNVEIEVRDARLVPA